MTITAEHITDQFLEDLKADRPKLVRGYKEGYLTITQLVDVLNGNAVVIDVNDYQVAVDDVVDRLLPMLPKLTRAEFEGVIKRLCAHYNNALNSDV